MLAHSQVRQGSGLHWAWGRPLGQRAAGATGINRSTRVLNHHNAQVTVQTRAMYLCQYFRCPKSFYFELCIGQKWVWIFRTIIFYCLLFYNKMLFKKARCFVDLIKHFKNTWTFKWMYLPLSVCKFKFNLCYCIKFIKTYYLLLKVLWMKLSWWSFGHYRLIHYRSVIYLLMHNNIKWSKSFKDFSKKVLIFCVWKNFVEVLANFLEKDII